jgi:hypothetical protein
MEFFTTPTADWPVVGRRSTVISDQLQFPLRDLFFGCDLTNRPGRRLPNHSNTHHWKNIRPQLAKPTKNTPRKIQPTLSAMLRKTLIVLSQAPQ